MKLTPAIEMRRVSEDDVLTDPYMQVQMRAVTQPPPLPKRAEVTRVERMKHLEVYDVQPQWWTGWQEG